MCRVRVLIVEDFKPLRRWLCAKLSSHKELTIVGEAEDGISAVQKASELHPDLILLDMALPGLNGFKAQLHISSMVPSAKIMFLTSCSDPDVVSSALGNGARGYILKSEVGELLSAIDAVIRGEIFLSSSFRQKPCSLANASL